MQDLTLKSDLKMAAYEQAARAINDRQESKKAQINHAKGAVRGLLDSAQFIEMYKSQELSNDNLDEHGIDPDDHSFLIQHLDNISLKIKDTAKTYEKSAVIYEGEQKGLDQAIDLIDKLNTVEVAKKERAIRDMQEELEENEDGEIEEIEDSEENQESVEEG